MAVKEMLRGSVIDLRERVIGLMISWLYILQTGNANKARCYCPARENGYCIHTMGLLYLIDHIIKLKAPTFSKVGTCTENPQQ